MGSDTEEGQDRGRSMSQSDLIVNSRSFRGYSFSEGVDTQTAAPEPKKGFFARFKKEKKAAEPRVPLSQLFRYATALDVFLMIVGSLAASAHGAILPLFSLIFGKLVDAFALPPEKLYDEITNTAVYFLYAGIGALALTYMQNAFWIHTSERQISRIRAAYVNAILRKHIGWFDKEDTGELTARIAGDTIVIQESLGSDVGKALQMLATAIAGIILGFVKGWRLTLVLLAVTPLLAAGGAFIVNVVASLTTKGQKAYAKAGAVATEVISSIRTVAAFSAEAKEVARYAVRLKEAKKVGIKRGFTTGIGFGITLFIMFGTYALALWYGGELVIDGKMTGGDVLATFFSVLIGAFSLGQAGPSAEKVSKGQGAAFKIYQTIDTPSEIDPLSKEGEVPTSLDGTIKLVDVHFHYPTRPDAQIMKGMSLKIKAGKTVALVGPSGAGKSSIVSLVQRFYDPIEGEVLLDGKNIKSMNLKWLRQQIGLVSQEPVLFSGTIADNISYGKEHATQDEIEAAAKAANAHNFISAFPDGYKTQVGEKGAQLSGGQKQRIAIARAIVKNPKILLLDEATSALDTESEKIVQEALDSVKEGRTTIVIAHRLSTIKNADVIAVINDGKVAEKGTHDELIAKDGIYAELVRAQSSGIPEKKRRKTKTSKKKKEEDVAKLLKSISEKEEEEGKKKKDVSLKRLFALNKPEAGYIFLACVAAIFNGAVNPIFAIIFSEMVAVYYKPPDQMRDETRWWALGFIGIGLVPLIFNTLQSWMFAIAGENLTERLRKLTFQAILRNDIAWFDKEENSTGILTARLASEATLIEGLVGSRLALSVQNFVTITAGLVIAFVYGWKLTLVILACSPLIAFANAMQMASMKGLGKQGKAATEAANQIATESIGNIRTVASFTNETNVLRKFEAQLDPQTRLGVKKAHISGFLMGLGELFLFGTYTLGFWYGGKLTKDGEMNLEQVLKVFMAIVLSAMAIGQTAGVAPDAAKAKAAATVIFDLIDHVPAFDSSSEAGDKISEPNGEIELKNVDFAYATRPDAKVMNQLNLTAEPGKVLALVGQSGCGKSSTISLLERFYDVNGGAVTFDGKNIKDLNIKWLRKQIGLVGQEPVLFSGTIADNIRYGKEDATDDEVKAAAKAANAHKFIKTFPDGYKTQVGEKGTQLSGGQKQRIAIARAIVRNPKILLLDEATSALDTESEKIVQAALDSVMTGRTTIVIAHRLSTIKNADVIAVIEGGKVVEKGTHDELVALQGAYYNLVQRQTM